MSDTDRDAWLAQRRTGIGGSDLAAILGLSPWRSPVDVWLDKTGRAPPLEPTPAMYWGTRLEELVAREYQEQTKRAVRRVNAILRHATLPMLGNIDRAVEAEPGKLPVVRGEFRTDRILECKTANLMALKDYGDEGTDNIPLYYLCQCLHYLALTGCKFCDVAALFGGQQYRQYTVTATPELIGSLWEQAAKWWRDYVVTDTPPPPRTMADALALFPAAKQGETRLAQDADRAAVVELVSVRDAMAELKAREDAAKDALCVTLASAGELLDPATGKALVTWRETKPTSKTDWQAVAAELKPPPELIAKHTETKPGARRFLVKSASKTERE